MATSGTVTFRSTRDEIIEGALRLCGAIDPENTAAITTSQTTNAAQALNMLVKAWEAEGLQLWERKYMVVFLQKGQSYYTLGSPGPAGDHSCLSTPVGSGFIKTTVATALAASGTSLSVTAASNAAPSTWVASALGMPYGSVGVPTISMANGDNIGIEQSDGTLFWTTINGAPSGTTVTLTAGPGLACAAGNTVYTYTTKMVRPLRILDGFIRQVGGNDVPIQLISRDNYNRFGGKLATGQANQVYYDPQENTGHLYVYPSPSDVDGTLFLEAQKPIEDFSAGANDFDLPQEWGMALKFGLAWVLAPEYGVPMDTYGRIKEQYAFWFGKLDSWDQEQNSIFLMPQVDMGNR